jgi:Uma2 family endonuclease
MPAVTQHKPQRMTLALFRSFCEMRPDEEQWELIDGTAIMMTPPTVAHQWIATNLQLLLYQALQQRAPMLSALQRLGVNLAPSVDDYDPEPDVAVVDADAARDPKRRYVDRFYLAAEIVSASDRKWINKKREVYKLHATCAYILLVQQDRMEVLIDRRINDRWSEERFTRPDDVLAIDEFGFRCRVADLYRGTALHPGDSTKS